MHPSMYVYILFWYTCCLPNFLYKTITILRMCNLRVLSDRERRKASPSDYKCAMPMTQLCRNHSTSNSSKTTLVQWSQRINEEVLYICMYDSMWILPCICIKWICVLSVCMYLHRVKYSLGYFFYLYDNTLKEGTLKSSREVLQLLKQKDRKWISVPCPEATSTYNSSMGWGSVVWQL